MYEKPKFRQEWTNSIQMASKYQRAVAAAIPRGKTPDYTIFQFYGRI